jgi:hypothetical protein
MAASIRITQVPVPAMELAWHLLTIFAILREENGSASDLLLCRSSR